MVFSRKARHPRPTTYRIGFRPLLLLMKLGHDLRQHYQAVLDDPLPRELRAAVGRLEAALPGKPRLRLVEAGRDRRADS